MSPPVGSVISLGGLQLSLLRATHIPQLLDNIYFCITQVANSTCRFAVVMATR